MTIRRVLIANRGEIAVRIIAACRLLGIETVVAASEADRTSLPARLADRSVCIGPSAPGASYLNVDLLVAAARGTNADALHPGYGFLAESPDLAEACQAHGITFVGPRPDQIRQMGDKLEARVRARRLGIPTLPGTESVRSSAEAIDAADRVGYPVMLKASAGGGGRGMKVVARADEMRPAFDAAAAEARAAFGDETLYLERFLPNARHVEVQVLGDSHGRVIHLGDRDCSVQRRHQKLIEEAPAPGLADTLRERIRQAAVTLARDLGYENAGTVEFILDQDAQEFYFLEMNTRLQVEHPVTEMITGIDIVGEQFRVARGERLRFAQEDIVFRGHAIECRINAESPGDGFRPSPGLIVDWRPPIGPNVRVDSHCHAGYTVPRFYDSLLAKLIVYGTDRSEAVDRMRRALGWFSITGVDTTIAFLHFLLGQPEFADGRVHTRLASEVMARAAPPAAVGAGEDREG